MGDVMETPEGFKEIYENSRKKPAARIDGNAALCYTVY